MNPSAVQQLEFMKLRAFVAIGFDFVMGPSIPPEQHPAIIADRWWSRAPSRTLVGLRQAAGDVVEMLQDVKGPQLAALEERLANAGAPSLAAMRERRAARVYDVLKRGVIRKEEEWYILNAVVADTADTILDAHGRELAETLLIEFRADRTT